MKISLQSLRSIDLDRTMAMFAGVVISVMSAWYSIAGLMAIFAGAAFSIMLMGIALEMGKIITASFLYRNWTKLPILMRVYFTAAVIVLMVITSIGTFGYLSRAHIQQSAGMGDAEARIERIERRIQTEQERLDRSEASLAQLDTAVNSIIAQNYATRGLNARQRQAEERQALEAQITESENRIEQLQEEKAPYQEKVRNLELEVGPIRYVTELIYGDSDRDLMEQAVRFLIIILVVVFDPLAVILIMAATRSTPVRVRSDKVIATDGERWTEMNAEIEDDKTHHDRVPEYYRP